MRICVLCGECFVNGGGGEEDKEGRKCLRFDVRPAMDRNPISDSEESECREPAVGGLRGTKQKTSSEGKGGSTARQEGSDVGKMKTEGRR